MTAPKKRDIMDDLLKGSADDASSDFEGLANLIHKEEQKARSTKKRGAQKRQPQKNRAKRKTTHYLSEDIFEDLDEAKERINDLIQKQINSKISKSLIVNNALKMILKDFEEKGEKSPFIQEILKDIFKDEA